MTASVAQHAQLTSHQIQPLDDSRWDEFVNDCEESSIFHSRGWLEALRRTYRYQPVVFTTSGPGLPLEDGLLFCRVDSWLTGKRLVSLPFSDHCAPLIGRSGSLPRLFRAVEQDVRSEKLRYAEIRPLQPVDVSATLPCSTYSYCLHQLDLTPDLSAIFANCHKDSTQRKIRRAEREGLVYDEGTSRSLLDSFYQLLLITRRRHGVPPQPKKWFQNLLECMGSALKIRVAFKDHQPIASILTLRHKHNLVYKYGCSNAAFHNLGAMQLLFWRSIEEAKHEHLLSFDFGRSELQNTGLITFKDRWGCARSTMTYSRYGPRGGFEYSSAPSWGERTAERILSSVPDPIFQAVGDLFYKHVG